MNDLRIAIVGGGPRCTYALERLAATLAASPPCGTVRIAIFERSGSWGAGETHCPGQPATSYLNRVVGQIAFAADESNRGTSPLLPRAERQTFAEWCATKHGVTGDDAFALGVDDVPRRYLHGMALREAFERYAKLLRDIPRVELELYPVEVTDVSSGADRGFYLHADATPDTLVPADRILFVTGHSQNLAKGGSRAARLMAFAHRTPGVHYVEHAYPLDEKVSLKVAPPGCSVGIQGLGLTAIDVVLALTEGRGGRFVAADGGGALPRLRYLPSGSEPARIVGMSRSGLVHTCRARNAKRDGVDVHEPVFFTRSALDTLRLVRGQPATLRDGRRVRQLDFERDIFPLVVLEMAYVYHAALFGTEFARSLCSDVAAVLQDFLLQDRREHEASIEALLRPIDARFRQVASYIHALLRGAEPPPKTSHAAAWAALHAFVTMLLGPLPATPELPMAPAARARECADRVRSQVSPWGHSANVYDHQFNWRAFFRPLGAGRGDAHASWGERLEEFLRWDLAQAAQNNLANPSKAACDGVWRDLRAMFAEAVDRGALLPESQRQFEAKYLRHYNRMANGAAIEPMRKILALIESKHLDISLGPHPLVEENPVAPGFRLTSTATRSARDVTVLIDARIHPFDPELDVRPLYPNLLRRGLVRKWLNQVADGSDGHEPGALDLSEEFHPFRSDGQLDRRLTFLGAPADRLVFFQLAAARPNSNSYVLNAIAAWAREALEGGGARWSQGDTKTAGLERHPTDDRSALQAPPSATTFRNAVRSFLEREIHSQRRRHVVILAIDGISYSLARDTWRQASVAPLDCVFPTTSSAGWLSSLSGMPVDDHGVPGVIFKVPDESGALINVFGHKGQLVPTGLGTQNIFSDAGELGYVPVCVQGDLEDYECSWRELLLAHSRQIRGFKFYTSQPAGGAPPSVRALQGRVRQAIDFALEQHSGCSPCLIWCFIETDRHVHYFGYDRHVVQALELLEHLAAELAQSGMLVLAHSDHGLTATQQDPSLQQALDDLQQRHQFTIGGAGRTRWIYPNREGASDLRSELERALSGAVRVRSADEAFGAGSLARRRVGEYLLIARDQPFLAPHGYRYDHGSLTDVERYVPFAVWDGC